MQRMAKQRWVERDFMLMQLYGGESWPKPAETKTPKGMTGINVRVRNLEQDWIVKSRDTGKKIGGWIGRNDIQESAEMYKLVFGETGRRLDYFYSD